MTKLTVTGGVFALLGTVASLAQAGSTANLAAPALGWNVARGNIAVTLAEAPTHLPKYAPYFCEFDIVADGVTDQLVSVDGWNKKYQSIFFKTTFGDPGTLHKTTKILEQHRSRNVSFTPGKPGHVYETPGTYTVTSDLCDLSGNTGTATHTVTVIDPEDPVLGYPANRTIVVDTAGNFTGAPLSDANNKVTTWEAATIRAKAIFDSTSGQAVRIMLRGGQTFAHTDASVGMSLRDTECIWIGRFGNTSPATVNLLGLTTEAGSVFGGVGAGQMKATDIIWQGPWDEEAEIWTAYDRGLFFSQKHAYEVLCHNVTFKGVNTCVSPSSVSESTAPVTGTGKVFMSNVVADGTKDFICLATGKGYGVHFLGCETIKSLTAHNGAETRWNTNIPGTVGEPNGLAALDDRNRYPRHAHQGYRGGGVRFCEFDGCAINQTHGWTGGPFSDNSCMRIDTAASADQNIYISRCKILGSPNYADASGVATVPGPKTNAMFQMCVFAANPTIGKSMYLAGSGFNIRSCLFLVPYTANKFLREMIELDNGGKADAETNLYPNVINGNTEVIDLTAGQLATDGGGNIWKPLGDPANYPLKPIKRVSDNATMFTALGIDDGPWVTQDSLKRFAYPGVSRGWEQLSTTLSASVANGETVTFPYWNDWFGAPLTQASFAGQDNRHAITIGSVHHNYTVAGVDKAGVTVPQNLFVSFGASGVTVTNLSGVTWASGAAVKLWVSRGTTGMVKDTTYAYDVPLILRAPTVGSPAYQTADPDTIWLVDLLGNYRPGTKHPLSPAGLPSKGAIEPASLA